MWGWRGHYIDWRKCETITVVKTDKDNARTIKTKIMNAMRKLKISPIDCDINAKIQECQKHGSVLLVK